MSDTIPRHTPSAVFISPGRQFLLAFLRIVIGWHFLYEGLSKLLYPGWSSSGYLRSATGPSGSFFVWMASNATGVRIIDQLNIWGLVLIGLALMLGLFVRPAAVSGVALLALYYFAHPPFFAPITDGEGNNLIVNRNLVELCALAIVMAFPSASYGLGALLVRRKSVTRQEANQATSSVKGMDKLVPTFLGPIPRRQVVASLAGVPFLGTLILAVLKKHGWRSFEATQLSHRANPRDEFMAGATAKSFHFSRPDDLKGRLPLARIGNVALSRMILGGNLMGGWAHARDLIYVDKLVKAYHHQDKIFETFALAESCGVNTILTNPILCNVIVNYWRRGGKIQFISDCGGTDILEMIQKSMDYGACACYIQGGIADRLVRTGQFDLVAKGLELIRKNGLPAGIGAHKLETVQGCAGIGLYPDFWMKTLHCVDYWSASPKPRHDNIWCESPVETVAYMKDRKEPWIAYKVLAAGALDPKLGFKYAFESGADFICVGMYDFQIVDDVNLALDVFRGGLVRQRQWCA